MLFAHLSVQEIARHALQFSSLCAKLEKIGLMFHTESIYTEMLYAEIEDHIVRVCEKRFNEPMIAKGLRWVRVVVLGWLRLVLCHGEEVGETAPRKLSIMLQWKTRLEYHLYKTFCDLR